MGSLLPGIPPFKKGVWVEIGGINPNKKGVGKIQDLITNQNPKKKFFGKFLEKTKIPTFGGDYIFRIIILYYSFFYFVCRDLCL
jgi:hypothetical protein